MKIIILSGGSRGDVQPYVALGTGLKQAGHDVRLATFNAYAEMIQHSGLTHLPVKGDISKAIDSAEKMGAMGADNPLKVLLSFNKMKKLVAITQADYYAACNGADAIIYHPGVTLGYFAAKQLDIPSILATPFPMARTREYPSVIFYGRIPNLPVLNLATHKFVEQMMWMASRNAVKGLWKERFGRVPQGFTSPFYKQVTQRNPTIICCSRHIFPRPDDWPEHIHMTGYWQMKTGTDWATPKALTDFLASGPPPIYVGFGSVGKAPRAMAMGRKFVNALLQTASQGIMAGELTNLSTDLTSGKIFRLDKAPHDWLFPRMGTIVHHGGAGTTAAAFTAGIPQVVVPFSNDQFAWGKRVEELGVGKCIRPTKNITFKDLIAIISEVQKPNYVNNAKILGEKLSSENGVSRAVAVIEKALQL